MNIKFNAIEYTAKDDFINTEYEFDGDVNSGWQILRNKQHYLRLGKGYKLLKTRLCGICSTDLARRFLPYPLPQIIGHEVVAQSLDEKHKFVVEINDTPYFRGDKSQDIFCKSGLYTHSPGRMTLGINRLPGGFGPYILAPKKAIIPIGNMNEYIAVLTEPFAAAMQAIIASPPGDKDSVAVLGPRKLGSLLIAGLRAYRRMTGKKYKIYALSKHSNILDICLELGADEGVDLSTADDPSLHNQFDIVYDTTGSTSGFELALNLARTEVHLKSTSGQKVCGLGNLTAFVVDELSLLPYNHENLEFKWENENRKNQRVYIAPGVQGAEITGKGSYRTDFNEAEDILKSSEFQNLLPRYDIAIASTPKEIDNIIRPDPENENSLVRPRGTILFKGDPLDNPLLNFISKGGRLRSSRCGDFHLALKLFRESKDIAENLSHYMISHVFPARELKTAFQFAKDSKSFKVIVKHI